MEEHTKRNGVLFGFPQAQALSNADVLQAKCDLLVVAGAEREITEANAERLQAQVVVEAISGSISRAGEDVMTGRGITVVPHMLASAGEAIAASVEWSQNTRFPVEAVDLRGAVATRLGRVCRHRRGTHSLREAAMLMAISRVAEQMRARGDRTFSG
jgi:glutamate dehydrogenase/leucine dehydrogenase